MTTCIAGGLFLGHRPKSQKHISDLIVAFVTGSKAPGFFQTIKIGFE
jgi:hypothetical protein